MPSARFFLAGGIIALFPLTVMGKKGSQREITSVRLSFLFICDL